MQVQRGMIRSGRRGRGGRGLVVAVTGARDGAGWLLTRRLANHSGVRRVVAVDDRSGDHLTDLPAATGEAADLPGVEWQAVDVTSPSLLKALGGCDVVVHTAVDQSVTDDPGSRSRRNIRAMQTVLTAAAAASVPRVIVVTSAMVYGAHADNPVPIPEDAPLAAANDGSLLGDLLEIEALVVRAPRVHPGLSVTVVRPAALVGPGVDTVLTRHFEAPRLLVVRGGEPHWQFCHIEDLASALEAAALGLVDGVVTVGCEGWLTQDDVEALSGRRRVELPPGVAFSAAERLHRLGVSPAPATELHYITYPWVVPATQLRAAGWRPAFDNATAFEALLTEIAGRHAVAGRRIGRRETATLGAAGATVAVLGTAAIVRRARRRRRGQ